MVLLDARMQGDWAEKKRIISLFKKHENSNISIFKATAEQSTSGLIVGVSTVGEKTSV